MFWSTITSTSHIWLIATAVVVVVVVATRHSPCVDCSWTASGLYSGVPVALACRGKTNDNTARTTPLHKFASVNQSINQSISRAFVGRIDRAAAWYRALSRGFVSCCAVFWSIVPILVALPRNDCTVHMFQISRDKLQ